MCALFVGDLRPLSESSPVRSLRSLPFPPLCSPNQEQLCSSTVVSHSLSGNLKAIKRAPRRGPTPCFLRVCVRARACLGYLRLHTHTDRDILCTQCAHMEEGEINGLISAPSGVQSAFFNRAFSAKKKTRTTRAPDVRVVLRNSPTLRRPPAASGGVLACARPCLCLCVSGGGVWVTWGHVVFERGTTQTRPR